MQLKRSRYSDWLRAEGLEFESLQGKDFSPLHVVQTGSGTHPASYPMGMGNSFHSPPTSAEVKNTWIYTSTPPYVFMA
jgi:hypothetical protein